MTYKGGIPLTAGKWSDVGGLVHTVESWLKSGFFAPICYCCHPEEGTSEGSYAVNHDKTYKGFHTAFRVTCGTSVCTSPYAAGTTIKQYFVYW